MIKDKIKYAALSAVCLASLFSFASCKDKEADSDVYITLNEEVIYLSVGEEYTLEAGVSPYDPMDKNIMWSVSDAGIATVEGGRVTAKSEGETTVTAFTNGKDAKCRVVVKNNK